jgi:hypothetical protein
MILSALREEILKPDITLELPWKLKNLDSESFPVNSNDFQS